MADITVTSSEPIKLIKLFEQFFPGIELGPMIKVLTGIESKGNLSVSKAIDGGEKVTVNLTINPDPVIPTKK